jgi:hypothetical protein
MPGVRQIGRRRFVRNLPLNRSVRWTQSSPRTGGVLRACPEYRAWRLVFEIGWLYPGGDIGAVSRDNVAIFFRHEHKLASDLSRSPGVRRFLATAGRPAVRSYVVILTAAIA